MRTRRRVARSQSLSRDSLNSLQSNVVKVATQQTPGSGLWHAVASAAPLKTEPTIGVVQKDLRDDAKRGRTLDEFRGYPAIRWRNLRARWITRDRTGREP